VMLSTLYEIFLILKKFEPEIKLQNRCIIEYRSANLVI
jgi:hypothetical protein